MIRLTSIVVFSLISSASYSLAQLPNVANDNAKNIIPTQPIVQVNSNIYWAMVPYYQPFASSTKQGRLRAKRHAPAVINLPAYIWVPILVYPNNQQPVHLQPVFNKPMIETVSVPVNMHPDFSYQLGKQAYQERNITLALEYFNHTLSLQPENAVAWHYRTSALYQLGKILMAQESAKRAGALFISQPENKAIILANLERIQGNPRSFLVEYRQTMTEAEANIIAKADLPKDLLTLKEQMLASAKK
jgi:tetratricopeptide (TPR) repeat protein